MSEVNHAAGVAELVRALLPGDARSLALLETLPVGVFIVAADGRQLYANKAAGDILGRHFEAGTSAEQRASQARAFISGTNEPYPPEQLPSMRALRGERVHVMDLEIRGPEHTVVIDVAAAPIADEHGNIVGSVATFHDVTNA